MFDIGFAELILIGVVGLLVIQDGKIVVWRDYTMPGVEQIIGPLVTVKQ